MSSVGTAPRAVVPVSNARAEASRKNGARSRGPKTPEGKARSAQNALKHGMRAEKYVVLPEEDGAEFTELAAALVAELAPVGARRSGATLVVAPGSQARRPCSRGGSRSPSGGSPGRIGWPPERGWGPVPHPGGQQAELFEERRYADGGLGLALIRDGNGTRSFETLLRYRGAAMAEFWRALRTLKALQAEQAAAAQLQVATPAPVRAQPSRPATRSQMARRAEPSEPERRLESPFEHRLEYVLPGRPGPGRTLHEAAARCTPNEPEPPLAVPPAPALPVAHGERATGRAIAGVLTPSAAGGGGGRRRAPER